MDDFPTLWSQAALTSLAFAWKALWAFVLGYTISSLIRVFATRERMQRALGEGGPRSVALATLFGLLSSSCSFAALATTRALFRKGAGLVPSLAFLLASTNLVIELGVVIVVFLSWEFVVGEYLGGLLLILATWGLVSWTRPTGLLRRARERDEADGETDATGDTGPLLERLRSGAAWRAVARNYFTEWGMVLADVTIGFAAAGAIAVFVPSSFFQALFPGSAGDGGSASFVSVLLDALVAPLAAFCTFIGSMGNVPLAGLLYHNGVSFAGIMAFLFSDLVVLPVLRIQIGYYGWRLAMYIAGVFLAALVAVSVALHYVFAAFGALPASGSVERGELGTSFALGPTLYLDLAAGLLSAGFWWLSRSGTTPSSEPEEHHHEASTGALERVLTGVAWLAAAWIGLGAAMALLR